MDFARATILILASLASVTALVHAVDFFSTNICRDILRDIGDDIDEDVRAALQREFGASNASDSTTNFRQIDVFRMLILFPAAMYCVMELFAIGPASWPHWLAAGTLAVIARVDQKTGLMQAMLLTILLWSGLACSLLGLVGLSLQGAVLGAMSGAIVMAVPAYLVKAKNQEDVIGEGDIQLMACIGAWFGALPVVVVAFVSVGLMIQIASRQPSVKKSVDQEVKAKEEDAETQKNMEIAHRQPFGPILVFSAFLTQIAFQLFAWIN